MSFILSKRTRGLKLLGTDELKETIKITGKTVECPVKGCSELVKKQLKGTPKNEAGSICPRHRIVIWRSTFEYPKESDNLLWKERSDLELLKRIKKVKRESRMVRERSEDAVSWNIFRFLERNNLIEGCLESITGTSAKSAEVIYWSYSQREHASWSLLNRARTEFGEQKNRGSEPDIIISTDRALFFFEAKLTSGNKKPPSNWASSTGYQTGGGDWFSKVFRSDYKSVAKEYYELMRFWLLGTWMAEQQGLDFQLINLVLSKREKDIEAIFKRHIRENQRNRFSRVAWETIYGYISKSNPVRDKEIMMRYFGNKTIGYDRKGELQKAFSLDH